MADKNERYVVQATLRRALTHVMNHCEKYPPRTKLPDGEVGRFVAAIEEHVTPGQPYGPGELSKQLFSLGYKNDRKLFDFLMDSEAFSYLHPAICSLLIEHAVHLSKRDGQIERVACSDERSVPHLGRCHGRADRIDLGPDENRSGRESSSTCATF